MMGYWFSNTLVNPGLNAVLVDSGPLAAGDYLVQASVSGNADCVYEVEQRDAANGATLHKQPRNLKAAVGNDDFMIGTVVPIGVNERLRISFPAAVTGTISGSLFLQRA